MINEISSNTLTGIRKNLIVSSFLVIIFFIGGAEIAGSDATGKVLNIGLLNLNIHHPDRLVWVLVLLQVYWGYWYLEMGAIREYYKQFDEDIMDYLSNEGRMKNRRHKDFVIKETGEVVDLNIYKVRYAYIPRHKTIGASIVNRDTHLMAQEFGEIEFTKWETYKVLTALKFRYMTYLNLGLPIMLSTISIFLLVVSMGGKWP